MGPRPDALGQLASRARLRVVVTLFVLVAIPVAAFTDCGTAAEYTILEGDSWVRSYCPRGETYSLKADQLVRSSSSAPSSGKSSLWQLIGSAADATKVRPGLQGLIDVHSGPGPGRPSSRCHNEATRGAGP